METGSKYDPVKLVDTPIGEYLPYLVRNMNNFSIPMWNKQVISNMYPPFVDQLVSMSEKYKERCSKGLANDDGNGANVDWEYHLMMKTVKFYRSRENIVKTLEDEIKGTK